MIEQEEGEKNKGRGVIHRGGGVKRKSVSVKQRGEERVQRIQSDDVLGV